jgi:hypothetical protein
MNRLYSVILLFYLFMNIVKTNDNENLICTNKEEAELLLYQICSLDISCRGLYNIPDEYNYKLNVTDPIFKSNYNTFVYIINKINILNHV